MGSAIPIIGTSYRTTYFCPPQVYLKHFFLFPPATESWGRGLRPTNYKYIAIHHDSSYSVDIKKFTHTTYFYLYWRCTYGQSFDFMLYLLFLEIVELCHFWSLYLHKKFKAIPDNSSYSLNALMFLLFWLFIHILEMWMLSRVLIFVDRCSFGRYSKFVIFISIYLHKRWIAIPDNSRTVWMIGSFHFACCLYIHWRCACCQNFDFY